MRYCAIRIWLKVDICDRKADTARGRCEEISFRPQHKSQNSARQFWKNCSIFSFENFPPAVENKNDKVAVREKTRDAQGTIFFLSQCGVQATSKTRNLVPPTRNLSEMTRNYCSPREMWTINTQQGLFKLCWLSRKLKHCLSILQKFIENTFKGITGIICSKTLVYKKINASNTKGVWQQSKNDSEKTKFIINET